MALDVALGNASNYIVVDDDNAALEAINFLKERRLGRATFFPLNIIKSRYINDNIIDNIKNIRGFIGIMSDLVSFDELYRPIIENQLGNVIVVENASTLSVIGKLINYKYRIVSLDGEIQHAGGSITGGTSKKNSMLNEKNELNNLKDEYNKLSVNITALSREVEDIDKEILDAEERENVLNKYVILLNDELFNKKTLLSRYTEEYKNLVSELAGIEDLKTNKLNDHLVELLENINKTSKDKELLEKEIKRLVREKNDLVDQINVMENKQRNANSNYNTINNELRNKEIEAGKLEVKLDNLLDTLGKEYNLTFDYASVSYALDMPIDVAREKVNSLKKDLSSLGNVNLGAIEEYERISKRYEFLENQKDDLENSSLELKDIIHQMDDIMIEKFAKSFKEISGAFTDIFKLMFKGGHGELKLSDPDDLLNTGIDIIAIPPGKKINSPVSLSGGEKALTAICLLFAILQVKPSPFVILDEAEAALDEVNVDMFGKYLLKEKERSQFIVITHKKRMMEYADSLYGVTMQESGVSKIVSAKLAN